MSVEINKQGQSTLNSELPQYLVNNFSESGNTTGWTLASGTLSNGIVTLQGSAPYIASPYFTVGSTDIIIIEFTVSLPTPSTASGSGKGIYLGSPTNQGVYVHTFNPTTKKWSKSTTANNNPYYLNAYNLITPLTQKHYFLGSEVDLNNVPYGETSNTSYPSKAIQLPSNSTITQSRLRSGYNTNTTMVINFSNPKIYKLDNKSYNENSSYIEVAIGNNWIQAHQIYEY